MADVAKKSVAKNVSTGSTRLFWIRRAAFGYSRSEVAAFLGLLALFLVDALFVIGEFWTIAAILAIATVVAVGLLALFSARRSRLVVHRVLNQMERDGGLLANRLAMSSFGEADKVRRVHVEDGRGDVERSSAKMLPRQKIKHVSSDRLRAYLEIGASMPDHRWLDNTILRNASVLGRDLLAWPASGGCLTYSQLEGWLALLRDQVGSAKAKAVLENLDVEWSLRLARVVALQSLQADDRLNALSLYRLIYQLHGPSAIKPSHTHGRVFQALAYDVGEYELAREISQRVRCAGSDLPFMKADLLNPFTPSPFASADAWLEEFNENFVATGLEPITLDMDIADHCPFDRVRCIATSHVEAGPLVTIVVSAWQPDYGLVTAIRSLLTQSWRPLEILVVDDASPDSYDPILQDVAALDGRIRIIKQPRNGGTYVARNTAMMEAKGEFMTFLDSDDWCHPRRIERQVMELINNPHLMSTTSRALRLTQNMVFNFPGVLAQRENASSLMFRLVPVRERIGYFDTVRKGADTEYALRIRRAFGGQSHLIVEENLALIRLTMGSLSREEFKPGWRHPSRAVYRRNYEYWQRAAADGGGNLRTQAAIECRSFPAPDRFQVEREGAEIVRRSTFDVVFVGDLRHGEESVRSMLDEIRACQRAGAKVAVLHMESFRNMARIELELFWAPIQEAIASGELDEVLVTDTADVGAVVIRDPAVLQFPSVQPSGLRVGRTLIMAATPPRDIAKALWYVPGECMRNAQTIFGARVHWVAQSTRVRLALGHQVPKSALENTTLPLPIDVDAWVCPKRRVGRRAAVIGRMSEDSIGSFPSRVSTLLAAYPSSIRYDVRMLGGRQVCGSLLGHRAMPDNWSLLEPSSITADAFLASCDFFVYFDRENRKPEPLRRLLEAMASGCVVVLPPKFADMFADAAVYCEPGDVSAVVDRFMSNGALFESQSMRARAFVKQHHSLPNFAQALARQIQQNWSERAIEGGAAVSLA